MESRNSEEDPGGTRGARLPARVNLALRVALVASVVLLAVGGQWLAAVSTLGIALLTLVPSMLGRRFDVHVPAAFELLAILFIVGALFLGEVRGYYTRFWWWDGLLHLGSSFLLGVLGFLLVYVLNQKQLGDLHLEPAFVAIFAFSFSLALGAMWEIFEFWMDQLFGLNMQRTGLDDTMRDLIVDVFGASVIALLGYGWLKTVEVDSFLERWIQSATGGDEGPTRPDD